MTKKNWEPKPPLLSPDAPPPYAPSSSSKLPSENTPLLSSTRPSYSSRPTASHLTIWGNPPPDPEQRYFLLRAYHRALDAVAARGWRSPAIKWPGSVRIVQVENVGGRRKRGCTSCSKKKRRRRGCAFLCCRLFLCFPLFFWILVALGVVVAVRRWDWGGSGGRGIGIGPGHRKTVRVAVVGAGPAGVSAAHTLSTSFNSRNIKLEIVLFEQKSQIGGRMQPDLSSQLNFLERSLHPGDMATGAVGVNVLRDRAKSLLGIELGAQVKERVREVGFFDGRSIKAKLTRPLDGMDWGTWLALLWKYKFSFLNAKELPTGTMASFGKLLRSRNPHDSVSDMVKAAELGSVVGMSAVERLRINGIAGSYVDEVLSPEVWRQTGQNVEELSDLAISMALEREAGVSATDGGNWVMLLEEILKRSQVDLRLDTRVTGLRKELVDEGREPWSIEYQRGGLHESEIFDHVIVAGPWNTTIFLKDQRQAEEVYYRSLFVTFLLSSKGLNKEYFGSLEEMPSQILPIPSANLPSELEGIHEISYVRDIYGPDINTEAVQKLYRILSARSLSEHDILAFGEGGVLQSHEERIDNAYPLMWPRKEHFGEFKLQEGLWHTGVVEGFGSSVDLSWIAGENVARLLGKEMGRRRI